MYLIENPVLQSELLGQLRRARSFAVLTLFVAALGGLVVLAWPRQERIDLTHPDAAQQLVGLFFLGQYLLVTLLAPALAAGGIAGEKERKTYEMLLASPLAPRAIVLGKLLASLCYLALLVVASLPVAALCLPLGGVSLFEVFGMYWTVLLAALTSGMISLAASSYFQRTASALVVSYLVILPLALIGLWFWSSLGVRAAGFRLFASFTLLPLACCGLCGWLFMRTSRRLLYPPDVGSEAQEVVDEEREQREAIGLVIARTEFPDRLFAPPKRTQLLPDGANPVFDKEMRSELFSQGTLLARLVIQISMLLALPMMAVCLFWAPEQVAWYVNYVVLFTMLTGPVFSAGSVSGERERQTLDLLLVTNLSAWQILGGKLLSALRVSGVLAGFILWPMVLACLLVPFFWQQFTALAAYLVIIGLSILMTSGLALAASVVFRKTAHAIMATYAILIALFTIGPAADYFAEQFYPRSIAAMWARWSTFTSPFAAAVSVPLSPVARVDSVAASWETWQAFVACYAAVAVILALVVPGIFEARRRDS